MIDYDPHKWGIQFFAVKGSMVREIISRVTLSTLFAVGATLLHKKLQIENIPNLDKVHALIGVSLGLLLVFRTNASYDRFWEGRKQWGAIVNESRNIGRAAAVYLKDDLELARQLVRWAIAFPWSTMHQLRGSKGLGPNKPTGGTAAPANIPQEDLDTVLRAGHIPSEVALRMSRVIQQGRERGRYSDYIQLQLDQNIQLLIDYMGACERIHKTPLPFAYVVHLRRMLVVYCLTLPFALVNTFGWVTIPVTFLVAYSLFGIEEIGVEIEDPFGFDDNDLPLERICETIERNLRAVMDQHLGSDK